MLLAGPAAAHNADRTVRAMPACGYGYRQGCGAVAIALFPPFGSIDEGRSGFPVGLLLLPSFALNPNSRTPYLFTRSWLLEEERRSPHQGDG